MQSLYMFQLIFKLCHDAAYTALFQHCITVGFHLFFVTVSVDAFSLTV